MGHAEPPIIWLVVGLQLAEFYPWSEEEVVIERVDSGGGVTGGGGSDGGPVGGETCGLTHGTVTHVLGEVHDVQTRSCN